jgi:hypothetical protein
MELKEFGAMTVDLLAWSDWLAAAGITHGAIESTGEYWNPNRHPQENASNTLFLLEKIGIATNRLLSVIPLTVHFPALAPGTPIWLCLHPRP